MGSFAWLACVVPGDTIDADNNFQSERVCIAVSERDEVQDLRRISGKDACIFSYCLWLGVGLDAASD